MRYALIALATFALSVAACDGVQPDVETTTATASLEEGAACGGFLGLVCGAGFTCVDDPSDTCDPKLGAADCIGICVSDGAGEGEFCGGIAGFPCADGLVCVDDPSDNCDPLRGGADCGGICVKPGAGEGEMCGGFAGIQCAEGLTCVDDPRDDCDPKRGGADCAGLCEGPRSNTCDIAPPKCPNGCKVIGGCPGKCKCPAKRTVCGDNLCARGETCCNGQPFLEPTCFDGDVCPISRARYKTAVSYLEGGDLASIHDELLRYRLATYHYKDPERGTRSHLGFMIDDVEPSHAVGGTGDTVDLYGYTSMAVAALQVQAQRIETLERELAALRAVVERK